ncbi:MAG: hypothetical protein AAFS01_14400 [Pseudomonadota bacterium]
MTRDKDRAELRQAIERSRVRSSVLSFLAVALSVAFVGAVSWSVITELDADIVALSDQNQDLLQQNQTLQTSNDQLATEVGALQSLADRQETELVALRTEVSRLAIALEDNGDPQIVNEELQERYAELVPKQSITQSGPDLTPIDLDDLERVLGSYDLIELNGCWQITSTNREVRLRLLADDTYDSYDIWVISDAAPSFQAAVWRIAEADPALNTVLNGNPVGCVPSDEAPTEMDLLQMSGLALSLSVSNSPQDRSDFLPLGIVVANDYFSEAGWRLDIDASTSGEALFTVSRELLETWPIDDVQ